MRLGAAKTQGNRRNRQMIKRLVIWLENAKGTLRGSAESASASPGRAGVLRDKLRCFNRGQKATSGFQYRYPPFPKV